LHSPKTGTVFGWKDQYCGHTGINRRGQEMILSAFVMPRGSPAAMITASTDSPKKKQKEKKKGENMENKITRAKKPEERQCEY